jgi:anion-transporting  ArsA/GET3 family ATPase
VDGGGFVSEIANAIPGIDEAMSFAEMLKYSTAFSFLPPRFIGTFYKWK